MKPDALCDLLTDLPWDSYTSAELNQINVLLHRVWKTVKNCQQDIRRGDLKRNPSQPVPLTVEQRKAREAYNPHYPPGQRFE